MLWTAVISIVTDIAEQLSPGCGSSSSGPDSPSGSSGPDSTPEQQLPAAAAAAALGDGCITFFNIFLHR